MFKVFNDFVCGVRAAFLLGVCYLLVGIPQFALAQRQENIRPMSEHENPIKLTGADGQKIATVPQFLLALVDLAFLIALPIIVIFLVYAGFLFVTAADNEKQTETARKVFLWTLVGAAIVLGAKVIAMAIQATLLEIQGAGGPTPP